jgi:hypothetical protein
VADPDGIVRTADGWISSSGTTTGPANLFGSITSTSNSSPRPQLLHRPFQNVAELGYVFRDTPWKTLNFFGPNSGDGALLDLFSVADEPTLVDDRVNLNSQQPLIMQSLLSGAGQNSDGTSTLTQPGTIATAFNSYAYSTPYVPTSSLALSAAQLPDFLNSLGTSDGLASIKGQREAVVRAMAGATQTRTWNVLIDVVAQVGRYPASAKTTNDFIVEGEKRYWLSAAIDRYTGKVIDQQMEPVNQ